jgi:hemerythrin-like domain-containing protein
MNQPAHQPQSMSELADRLSREHHDLDLLCWNLYKAVNAGERHTAETTFERFAALMEPHFHDEDDRLFESIVAANPRLAAHARDMATEHDKMRALAVEMRAALTRPFDQQTLFLCERLLRVLRGHAQKEELLLFQHAASDGAH